MILVATFSTIFHLVYFDSWDFLLFIIYPPIKLNVEYIKFDKKSILTYSMLHVGQIFVLNLKAKNVVSSF